MQNNLRCGSLFAALAMSMVAVGTADAQQAPAVQQRQVQSAQPGQPLPGQPARPGQPLPGQPVRPGQPGVVQQGRPAQGQQQADHGTHVMAHWLLVDNQGEIELAKFAQEKAQSEEVKEFAKMMIQDHSDFLQALQQTAGGLEGQGRQGGQPGQLEQPPRPPQPGQRGQGEAQGQQQQRDQERSQDDQGQARNQQDGQQDRQAGQAQGQNQQDRQQAGQEQGQQNRAQFAQPTQPGQAQPGQIPPRNAQRGAPGQAGGMGFDIVRIKHELGQQCLASAKEALSEKEGAEFDTCYMDHQLFAHMQMLDTLKVFKRHAQGDMAELIQNGIATTEDHLMHAEKLVKQLHGGAAASTARRPGAQRD